MDEVESSGTETLLGLVEGWLCLAGICSVAVLCIFFSHLYVIQSTRTCLELLAC